MQAPFLLSHADVRPMYLQIIENIKHLIISGQWLPDQNLPSIRELAVSLKVSVITVKRAYQELEHEGVITTRQGKGSIVSKNIGLATNQKYIELEKHLNAAVKLGELLMLEKKELIELMALSIDALGRTTRDSDK